MNPFVFVVGCSRSGTTLLKRMINGHPQVAMPLESHWITKYYKERRGINDDGTVNQGLVEHLRTHKKFAKLNFNEEHLASFYKKGEKVSYPEFVSRVYDAYGVRRRKRLVGDKTPNYTREIPLLHQLFPRSKFIHIMRDGRNVGLSVLNWKRARVTVGRMNTFDDDPMTTMALWWEWIVRSGREGGQTLPDGLYKEVIYEDLLENPEAECRKIAAFLDLPYDQKMVNYYEGKEKQSEALDAKAAWLRPTKGLRDWTNAMSPHDVASFEAAAGSLLDELGYARATPTPTPEHTAHAAAIRARFNGHPLPKTWGP